MSEGNAMPRGYDKVYNLLLYKTASGQRLIEDADKIFNECSVFKTDFQLVSRENGEPCTPYASPSFKAKLGTQVVEFNNTKFGIHLNIGLIVSTPATNNIILNHFGNDVKTFNCKKQNLLDGRGTSNSSYYIPPFCKWVKEQLVDRDSYKQIVPRLEQQYKQIIQTKEYDDARTDALRLAAIEEIRQVVKKFSFLGKPLLKDALDVYIVHELLEV